MMRTGKIARLPYSIRDLLNQRLHNGEQGAKLVKWLNGLPEVQDVLTKEFGGRPISEQNLSEWKQGGFDDWLRNQETRAWVRTLAEESADLEEEAGNVSVTDWLAAPLAVALGRWIHELTAGAQNNPAQRSRLLAIAREVAELRRGDHRAQRLRIDRERWDAEQQEKQNEELEKLKEQAEAAETYTRFLVAYAERQYEEKVAAGTLSHDAKEKFQQIFAISAELECSRHALNPRIAPSVGHQTESNRIQPNQTNANKRR